METDASWSGCYYSIPHHYLCRSFLLSGMGKNTQMVGKLFMSETMGGHLSEVSSEKYGG